MFRSNAYRLRSNRPGRKPAAGFTLLEVMVSTLIFGTVSIAVMGAFVFLGENMTRVMYTQQLQENSRRAFYLFNQDASKATKITTATDSTVILTLPSTTVKYAYDSSAQTVTRSQPSDGSGTVSIVLKNLTSFDFNYFNSAGTAITVPQSASSSYKPIKSVQFSFISSLGGRTATGTAIYRTTTRFQAVSPIVYLRNSASNGLLP
jgi:prepilin-type N-terminal cleavage/methylation domain-containing protein